MYSLKSSGLSLLLVSGLVMQSLILLGAAQDCESVCRFRFCSNLTPAGVIMLPQNVDVTLSGDLAPGTMFPCLPRGTRRPLRMENVEGGVARAALAGVDENFVPITRFSSFMVNPDFSPDLFQWVENSLTGEQSIARIESVGNQERALDDVCVQMPVTAYQLLRNDGTVRRTVRATRRRNCVGFRTRLPQLLVDLQWSSTNSLDLRLTEPNGFQINRFGFRRRSPNGGTFLIDNGSATCSVDTGEERIRYLAGAIVEPGTYTVSLDHNTGCEASTKYRLRVIENGKTILDKEDVVTEDGRNVIQATFEIGGGGSVMATPTPEMATPTPEMATPTPEIVEEETDPEEAILEALGRA